MKDKLTLQELELLNTASAYNGEQHKAICGRAALELIEYKKIEDELGIDLITLFKAINKGIYINLNHSIKRAKIMNADIKHKTLTYITLEDWNEEWLNFIDYGKTWALTEKELL